MSADVRSGRKKLYKCVVINTKLKLTESLHIQVSHF